MTFDLGRLISAERSVFLVTQIWPNRPEAHPKNTRKSGEASTPCSFLKKYAFFSYLKGHHLPWKVVTFDLGRPPFCQKTFISAEKASFGHQKFANFDLKLPQKTLKTRKCWRAIFIILKPCFFFVCLVTPLIFYIILLALFLSWSLTFFFCFFDLEAKEELRQRERKKERKDRQNGKKERKEGKKDREKERKPGKKGRKEEWKERKEERKER